MAGSVLPQTNDPMPNINTNKQGWGTDAAGTDLTEGDKYKDLINVKGAKFLDLYNSSSVKIDDADDLKEVLKEKDVYMSIAFNDNPDNDEFRKAYIVVITKLNEKDTTDKPSETVGNIKLSAAAAKKATLTSGKLETLSSNGKTDASFSFDVAEWAAPTNTATTAMTLKWTLYVNGEKWSTGTDNNIAYAAGGPATDKIMADSATQGKITKYTANTLSILTGASGDERVVGKKLELVIDDITYDEVRVRYQLADGTTPVGTPTGVYLTTANGDTLSEVCVSADKYTNIATDNATYVVTGALADDGTELKGDFDNSGNISTTAHAVGDDWVTVTITGLTVTKQLDASTETYGTTPKGLFTADAKIGKIGDILKAQGVTDANMQAIASGIKLVITPVTAGDAGGAAAGDDTTGQLYGKLISGNQYKIKLTYDKTNVAGAETAAGVVGYDFKVTVKNTANGTITLEDSLSAAGDTKDSEVFKVDKNIEVEVEIVPLKTPKVTSAKYEGDATGGVLTIVVDACLKNTANASSSWFTCSAATTDFNTEGTCVTAVNDEDAGTCTITIKLSKAQAADTVNFAATVETVADIAMNVGDGATLTLTGTGATALNH